MQAVLFALGPRHIDDQVSLVLTRVEVTEDSSTRVVARAFLGAYRTARIATELGNDFDRRCRRFEAHVNDMPRRFDSLFSLQSLFGCSDAKESPSFAGSTSQSSRQPNWTAEHLGHQRCPQTHSKCCARRVSSVKGGERAHSTGLKDPPKIVSAFF